jgi:hypothetical protein
LCSLKFKMAEKFKMVTKLSYAPDLSKIMHIICNFGFWKIRLFKKYHRTKIKQESLIFSKDSFFYVVKKMCLKFNKCLCFAGSFTVVVGTLIAIMIQNISFLVEH